MKANLFLVPLMLASIAVPVEAQDLGKQTMTIIHAVANNKTVTATAKELALKEHFAKRCDGQEACSQEAREIVPAPSYLIEVTYVCRNAAGSARQIGPKHFDGTQTIALTCG